MTAICESKQNCMSKDKFGNCHSLCFCRHKSFKDLDKDVGSSIRFEVKDVMCDYGVFENGKLQVVTNSRANALLIKHILQQDIKGVIVKSPFSAHPKRRRKLRAMTKAEWCGPGKCQKCEYHWGDYYCLYPKFNGTNQVDENGEKPYKTKDGKYILIEVKE